MPYGYVDFAVEGQMCYKYEEILNIILTFKMYEKNSNFKHCLLLEHNVSTMMTKYFLYISYIQLHFYC